MNNSPLKVSVIVPSYNLAEFLPKTLESILKQDYQPLEIVVIDDGSTDNTASVIEPYLDRVRYVYQNNGGEASARNRGIKASTGEALMFVDADDLLPEGAISALANQLTQLGQDYCLVHGELERFDHSTGITISISDFDVISQNRRKIFTRMSNLILASVIRREALDKVGWFDEELRGSVITNMVMKLAKVGKLYSLNKIVYRYRIRENSLSRTSTYEKTVLFTQQRKNSLSYLLKGESLSIQLEAWSAYYFRAGMDFVKYKPNLARMLFLFSFLFYPLNLGSLKLFILGSPEHAK